MRPLQNCDPATAREAIDIGCRELRTMFIAVCRESGHDVCGPSGVVDQSCALTRSPIVEDGELSGAPTMPSSTANPAATLCHDYTFVRKPSGEPTVPKLRIGTTRPLHVCRGSHYSQIGTSPLSCS